MIEFFIVSLTEFFNWQITRFQNEIGKSWGEVGVQYRTRCTSRPRRDREVNENNWVQCVV